MRTAALLLCLAGCATVPPLPETLTEFVPTGEVRYGSHGAAFDAVRVRKPNVNLTKRADGSWGGVLGSSSRGAFGIDATVTPKRVTGVGLTLVLAESDAEKGTVITGQWQGNMVRFEIGPEQALIRTPGHSITLTRSGPTTYGARGELELTGDAALAEPPWPQFGFALLAAFMAN
jgi:hypothetical protein